MWQVSFSEHCRWSVSGAHCYQNSLLLSQDQWCAASSCLAEPLQYVRAQSAFHHLLEHEAEADEQQVRQYVQEVRPEQEVRPAATEPVP